MRAGSLRIVLVAAVCVVGTVALAACSDEAATLDQGATERAVGQAVATEVKPSVTATRCEGDLAQKAGRTFSCTVTLQGVGDLPVQVEQVDDEGALDVNPAAAVVAKDRIVSELTASLKKRFRRSFSVRCDGGPFEIRTPSSTSACRAKDDTSSRKVTVTVTDASGTLAFAVRST